MAVNLLYLISIALVRSWNIVRQRLWTRKLMIGRRRGDDDAVTGDLAGKAGDGAGHFTRTHINKYDLVGLGLKKTGSTLIYF